MKMTEALKLRKVRLYLNLTQKELGKRIGLSASTISNYETEHRTVSLRVRKWVNKMYRKHHLSKKLIKAARDNSLCAFVHHRCYSINDDDRIHHCFREIRGGWSITYTDCQLVDKCILEVPYITTAG